MLFSISIFYYSDWVRILMLSGALSILVVEKIAPFFESAKN